MNLHILMGQRKCTFLGEYAPEALAIMDENGYENNPGFLDDLLQEHGDSDEFASLAIIVVEVSDIAIERRLSPELPPINGKVVGPPEGGSWGEPQTDSYHAIIAANADLRAVAAHTFENECSSSDGEHVYLWSAGTDNVKVCIHCGDTQPGPTLWAGGTG